MSAFSIGKDYMKLKKRITETQISLRLQGTGKRAIIEELLDLAMTGGRINNRQAALECLLERENRMSTGIQCGIAIPHGKSSSVEELVVSIGIHPKGINFASLDGMPSRIFIMTLSPLDQVGPHVQFLAEISRILRNEENRQAFLAATSPADIINLL